MSTKDQPNGNGRVQWLLWLNTLLTALILPLLAFLGSQLWTRVDSNGRELFEMRVEFGIVKDRQDRVLETLPQLLNSDNEIRRQIEEHLRDVQSRKQLP